MPPPLLSEDRRVRQARRRHVSGVLQGLIAMLGFAAIALSGHSLRRQLR